MKVIAGCTPNWMKYRVRDLDTDKLISNVISADDKSGCYAVYLKVSECTDSYISTLICPVCGNKVHKKGDLIVCVGSGEIYKEKRRGNIKLELVFY